MDTVNQPELYAYIAKMHSILACIEGMKAANIERVQRGQSLAYNEFMFFDAQTELEKIVMDLGNWI